MGVPQARAEQLVHHWDEGWNTGDVDTIMAPFSEDVVFTSPFIGMVSGVADRAAITGRDALRAYVERALRRTPGIRYTVRSTYVGADAVVLTYTCHLPDGRVKEGADSMRVDDAGLVTEWSCHYTAESL